jgi:adenylate cyclase
MADGGRRAWRMLGGLWRRTPNWLVTALPGLVVTLLLLALHMAEVTALVQLGNLLFDTYQRAEPREYKDAPVRVVDIDDETIARLGQWPWPRTDVARLTQALTDAGSSAVAFDIVFSEPDRTSPARAVEILRRNPQAKGSYAEIAALPDHDVLMGQTMAATPSVMGFFLTREPNAARPPAKAGFAVSGDPPTSVPHFKGAILPLPAIVDGAAGAGFVSIVGGRDGIIRSAPLVADLDGQMVPSLSLEALRVAQGAGAVLVRTTEGSGEMGGGDPGVVALKVGAFEVPTTPAGELWMYYTDPRPERIVPAWKILTGELPPAEMERLFAGHIVFIGTGAAGLRDLVSTPVRDRELGVVVHAQAVEQMILGEFLVRPDWAAGLERSVLLLAGIVLSLWLPSLGALRGGIAAGIALGTVVAGSWVAFQNGLLVDPTVPSLGLVGVFMAVTSFSFYREERARAYIRNAFDRYLSPELVERIARDPSQLQLGGEEREMTVMFCDIRSFSRISEKLSPQQIIGFLIEFLTPMTEILLARKATIDKYIGDAILAFWNAPLDDPEHERNAALATLEMVAQLKELNATNVGAADKVWPGEVKIGIGLSTGPCCVGNMGSTQRLNYSLIGDTVNLASRIEGLTKVYGVPIMMGETLARRLDDFAVVELDIVRVVGRDTPERLFALMGPPEMAQTVDFRELAGKQTLMLAAYRKQDWDAAEAALAGLSGPFGLDAVAKLYAGRVAAYRKTPPPKGWDGVFEATEK